MVLASGTGTGVEIRDLVVDESGNTYVLGVYSDIVNFGGITKSSFGPQNAFLAKYGPAGGNPIFVRAILGAASIQSRAIALDPAGFIYLTGSFEGNAQIETGGTPVFENIASAGAQDIFVIKYNTATLLFQWAYTAGGTGDDSGHGIDVGPGGTVFVTGGFQGTVDFDGGGILPASVSAGAEDAFVLKLNALKNVQYVFTFGDLADDRGLDLAVSAAGEIYAAGYFEGAIAVDPVVGATTVNSQGGQDGFFLAYSDGGTTLNYQAGLAIGGGGNDVVKRVKLTRNGQPVIAGNFEEVGSFGNALSLTSNGGADFFLGEYSKLLLPSWVIGVGGASEDILNDFTRAPCGEFWLSGSFSGTTDFDPGAGTSALTGPVPGGYFVAQYDASGGYLWAGAEQGIGRDNEATCLALDPGGNLLLGRNSSSALDADISAGLADRPHIGTNQNSYLSKHSTGRIPVTNTNDMGSGSLRSALGWAGSNFRADTVCFCLPGAGPHVITPATSLTLQFADSTVIDATTQPGWSPGLVRVEGMAPATYAGVVVNESSVSEIYGLRISGFQDGLNLFNSTQLVVGGVGKGNQIVSNADNGIRMFESSGSLLSNEIGSDATATVDLGNGDTPFEAGIALDQISGPVRIGGLGAGEGNVIAFNMHGVLDYNTSGATPITTEGNTFACNATSGIISVGTANPVIVNHSLDEISGLGPANSTILIYTVNTSSCAALVPCQGFAFLDSTTSDAFGNWAMIGTYVLGTEITATATSPTGTTSAFSLCETIDNTLEQNHIVLELSGSRLRWTTSSGAWVAFDMERLEQQDLPELVASLSSQVVDWEVSSPGLYQIRGHRADGTSVLSNAIEVGQGQTWVIERAGSSLRLGRWGQWQGRVIDGQGRHLWSGGGASPLTIPTQSWSSGVYVLQLNDGQGNGLTRKIGIQ